MTTAIQQRFTFPLSGIVGCTTCGILILSVLLSGCGSDDGTKGPTDVPESTDAEIPVETILQNLQPDVFGITVPRTLPRGDLDEWAESMLADMIDADVDEKELAEQLAQHLEPEQVERVLRRQFALQDCTHVRDMLWARELLQAIHVPWEAPTDLDRAVAAFYHVIHTIALTTDPEPVPLGPFEAMLYGTGTAADRAWAFAILMHQRRMPVVVLSNASADTTASLLVGVLVGTELHLFDAARGLPIPGPDDAPEDALIRKVATLTQAIADESLLRQLDVGDTAYPVTAGQLQQAELQIVGDTSLWSRRMEGLNNALTGSAIVYSPLVGETGMLQRLTEVLSDAVAADRFGTWAYPDQQRQARESLSEAHKTQLAEWNAPQQVPYLIRVTSEPGVVPPIVDAGQSGRQTHRVARVDQVLGRPQKAIPRFLKIQGWREVPPTPREHPVIAKDPETVRLINAALPEKVRTSHADAAEQARFWRATSQLQQGNWSTASQDLEAYIVASNKGTTTDGRYRSEASYLCGVAHAMQRSWGYAAAYMRLVPADSPAAPTARLLARRWAALAR